MTSRETWSDHTMTQLRQLWKEGHTTAEIGRRLAISKNAVVGKVRRLALDARPSPIRSSNEGEPSRPPRPKPPKLTDILHLPACPPTPPPKPSPSARVELSRPPSSLRPEIAQSAAAHTRSSAACKHACCWPIGEPGSPAFRFCGDPALAGKPYCERHAARAYQPKPARNGHSATTA